MINMIDELKEMTSATSLFISKSKATVIILRSKLVNSSGEQVPSD
jgi:hypothetical protein